MTVVWEAWAGQHCRIPCQHGDHVLFLLALAISGKCNAYNHSVFQILRNWQVKEMRMEKGWKGWPALMILCGWSGADAVGGAFIMCLVGGFF